MRRWALRITLLLLAGALTTWAVAWACALWAEKYHIASYARPNAAPANLPVAIPPGWIPDPPMGDGVEVFYWEQQGPGLLCGMLAVQTPAPPTNPIPERCYAFWHAGWPFYALQSVVGRGSDGTVYRPDEGHLAPPKWLTRSKRVDVFFSLAPLGPSLPYHPLARGFVLDSLLYAAIFAVLWLAPPAALRATRKGLAAMRRRAGRCEKCGYDRKGLAADAPCPECGEAPRA